MKIKTIKLFATCLLFAMGCFPTLVKATHLEAGWIEYQQVDSNTYNVRLVWLAGNGGVPLPPIATIYAVSQSSSGYSKTTGAVLTRKDTITQQFTAGCYGIIGNDVFPHVYEGTINLSPNTVGYRFYIYETNRPAGLANLITVAGQGQGQTLVSSIPGFHAVGLNNSPVFDPIARSIACVNTPFSIDLSGSDPDSDSLVYRLSEATGVGGPTPDYPVPPCNYKYPYTGQYPVASSPAMQLDSATGVFFGTPSILGFWVVKMVVDEYRNGQLIGSYDREILLSVSNCGPLQPTAVIGGATHQDTIRLCTTLTHSFQNGSSEATDYYWDFDYPNGVDTSTAKMPTHTFPDSGVYEVMLVAKVDDTTCIDTAFTTVVVHPIIHSDILTSDTLCGGDTVHFQSSINSPYGAITQYSWDFGDGDTSNQANPAHLYQNPGSFTARLNVENAFGCRDSVAKWVDIDTLPSIQLPPPVQICIGDTVYPSFSTNASQFLWSPSVSVVCDTCLSPGFYPTQTTIYTLALGRTSGCTNQVTYTVIVDSLPRIGIDVSPTPHCLGDSILLRAQYPAATYQWSTGAADSSIWAIQSGVYKLTITDTNSCIASDSVLLNINPIPTPEILLLEDSIGCPNDQLRLTIDQSYPSHTWSLGGSADTIQAQTGALVWLHVTDSNGCEGGDTVQLYKYPIDTLEIRQNPPISGCQADTISLFTSHAYSTYYWSSSSANDTIVISQSGSYWVEVMDSNGCTQRDTVDLAFTPEVNIISGDTVYGCIGDSIQLSASFNTIDITWSTGDTSSSIWVDQSGTYTATVGDTGCFAHDTIEVIFRQRPTASITNLGTDSICSGDTTMLKAIIQTGGNPSYQWSTGSTDSIIDVTTAGTYQVTATNTYGCATIDSHSISIYPQPTVVINATSDTVCTGDTVTLSANWTGGDLEWFPPHLGIPVNQPSFTFMPSSTWDYVGTVTSPEGCIAKDAVRVVVNPSPTMVISPQDTIICSGQLITYSVSGGSMISWSPATFLSNPAIYNPVAQPTSSVSYHVVVTDTNGCQTSDSAHVTVDSLSVISGTITTSQGMVYQYGKVLLIAYNPVDSTVSAIDTTFTNTQGQFVFTTNEQQVYLKAIPDTGAYPFDMPTYFDSALVWDSATAIANSVSCGNTVADFTTIGGINPGGSGFISGNVYQGAGKMLDRSDPIQGLTMILMDSLNNQIGVSTTDMEGHFRFNQLTSGTYTIWADQPFMRNDAAPEIQLIGPSPGIDSLWIKYFDRQLFIDPTMTHPYSNPDRINIFPNPASTVIFIEKFSSESNPLDLMLISPMGTVVLKRTITDRMVKLPVGDLSSGVYFIHINGASDHAVYPAYIIR